MDKDGASVDILFIPSCWDKFLFTRGTPVPDFADICITSAFFVVLDRIKLLREVLDLPEVSLVAVIDADNH